MQFRLVRLDRAWPAFGIAVHNQLAWDNSQRIIIEFGRKTFVLYVYRRRRQRA